MGGSLWGGGIGVQAGRACKGHACSLGAARGKAVGGEDRVPRLRCWPCLKFQWLRTSEPFSFHEKESLTGEPSSQRVREGPCFPHCGEE